jgi:zinc/manganese transport system permease protein
MARLEFSYGNFIRCHAVFGTARVGATEWDPCPVVGFLFYAAFGLVVTSSVKAAGILAVFTFLIVPTVCAVLLGKREAAQLWWAWGIGIVGSTIAVVLSYVRDWPTGASVVCVFGCGVVLVSIARTVFQGMEKRSP